MLAEALAEDAAEDAVRYRPGERGTFHRLASSGRSSSESSYCCSISFAVFLGRFIDPLPPCVLLDPGEVPNLIADDAPAIDMGEDGP